MGPFSRMVVAILPLVPKPIVGIAAKRYVAGETVDDAVRAIRQLNAEGAMATLDVLGEEVTERDRAAEFTDQYVHLFDTIREQQLDSNVSVKLTMLGLKMDPEFCRRNLDRICQSADSHGNFLRIDMEDHTVTDITLQLYREMLAKHGNVGAVLQSYMRRTQDDIRGMPAEGVSIRLCKGIYVEPEKVAYKGYQEVRDNFVASLELMIERGIYPAIATHDSWLVDRACEVIEKHGLEREQYEFQMLYGVQPRLRRKIIDDGHRMRVYVPFGRDWHPYSIRRLRENPAVAGHVIKAFFGIG
jgi:proline dehydrogenase